MWFTGKVKYVSSANLITCFLIRSQGRQKGWITVLAEHQQQLYNWQIVHVALTSCNTGQQFLQDSFEVGRRKK